jgi:DNA-binding transcriptional LysR family regulator
MKISHNLDLDLNLLYTLHVLLEELNVSKAAARLALSQSAVSHSLKKLRDHFHDQLLIKTRHGMVPTSTAVELQGRLRILIHHVQGIFREEHFDPAVAKSTIRVAATDYGASLIFPALMERLAACAPKLKIDCVPLNQNISQDLQNGLIDIAFGGYKPFNNAEHEVLFHDRYVGVVRVDHPILHGKITKQRLSEWKHVFIKVPISTERKDKIYKNLGYRASDDFFLRMPYYMIAALPLEKSDMILIMPEKGSMLITHLNQVTIFELPDKINKHAYLQSWHKRNDNDTLHQWFRAQVKDICKNNLRDH